MSSDDEEIQRLREELAAATRARELLLASVAHDLRNPLNTFAMSAGLLRDDLENTQVDPKRALSLLTRMDRASTRMQALIEDLLEASRIEAKAIPMTPSSQALAPAVRDAITKAKPSVTERNATIEETSFDDAVTAKFDKARLTDAVVKLIAVAMKSVGEGGGLKLAVTSERTVTITTQPPRGLTVKPTPPDVGKGGLALLIAKGLLAAQSATVEIIAQGDSLQTTIALPQ